MTQGRTATGERTPARRVRPVLLEGTVLLALLCGAVAIGADRFFVHPPDNDSPMGLRCSIPHSSALGVALGLGLGTPETDESNIFHDFLNFRRVGIPETEIPQHLQLLPPDGFDLLQRYLFTTMGLVWRLWGISWDAIKAMLIVFFAVSALLVYGICRLAMNRWLSAAAAALFCLSPSVHTQLPAIRDFPKAAFLLAIILVVGVLVARRVRTRWYLGLAVVLGLVLGGGLGFRTEVMLGLPPAVLTLAFCPLRRGSRQVRTRCAGLGLLAVAFFASSYPLVSTMEQQGNPAAMYALHGLGASYKAPLSIEPASYDLMYVHLDNHTFAATTSYGRRVLGFQNPIPFLTEQDAAAANHYLWELATTFPADFLVRAYASVMQLLGGSVLWLCLAVLALGIIAARNPLRATLAALLVLYFLGIYGVQFVERHHFYLVFVPAWVVGFLVNHALTQRYRLRKLCVRLRTAGPRQWTKALWTPPVRRACLFVLAGGVFVLVPLLTARWYQASTVDRLQEPYEQASLTPLDTNAIVYEDVVFERLQGRLSHPGWYRHRVPRYRKWNYDWPWPAEYLMAEFSSSPAGHSFWLTYEAEGPMTGMLSNWVHVPPSGRDASGTVRCFFPVYECHGTASHMPGCDWSRFAGLMVPAKSAPHFKGLYRCDDLEPFRLLPCWFLPSDRAFARYCEGLSGEPPTPPPPSPVRDWRTAREAAKAGNLDAAREAYTNAIAEDPQNVMLREQYADILQSGGDLDNALAAHRAALETDPEVLGVYERVDDVLEKRGDAQGRAAYWKKLAAHYEGIFLPHVFLARAYQDAGEAANAVQACRKAVALNPGEAALHAYLGELLLLHGDLDEAEVAHNTALAAAPGYGEFLAGRSVLRGEQQSAGRALAEYESARAAFPELEDAFTEALGGAARQLQEKGLAGAALELYEVILERFPADANRLCAYAGLLAQEGRTGEAITACVNAIGMAPGMRGAYEELARVLDTAKDRQRTHDVWRRLTEAHPEQALPFFFLGRSLQAAGNFEEAIGAYRKAIACDSRQVSYHTALIEACGMAGDAGAAGDSAKTALDSLPGQPVVLARALANVADSLLAQEDPASAIRLYRVACDLDRESSRLRSALGSTLLAQGDHRAARALYREAIAMDVSAAGAYEKLDRLLAKFMDAEARATEWQAVVQCHPTAALAQLHFGRSLAATARFEEALQACRKGIALAPASIEAHVVLISAYGALGDPDAALAAADEAWKLSAGQPVILANALAEAALALLAQEDLTGSIRLYRMACDLDRESPWLHSALGFVLGLKGDHHAARVLYRKAIAMDTSYAEAYERLDRLLIEHMGAEARTDEWQAAVQRYPEVALAQHYLGQATGASGEGAPGAGANH